MAYDVAFIAVCHVVDYIHTHLYICTYYIQTDIGGEVGWG